MGHKAGGISRAQQNLRAVEQANQLEIAHVRALARSHTEKAIEQLAVVMADIEASGSARVMAARALLEFGWGKPTSVRLPMGGADSPSGGAGMVINILRLSDGQTVPARESQVVIEAAAVVAELEDGDPAEPPLAEDEADE